MKTLIYFFVILQIFIFANIQGQDTTSLDEKVMTATSLLPTSDITTDIFYNQVPEYFPFRFLDGINMGDSVYLDKERYKFSYGMLTHAHLDSFAEITIDSLWGKADSLSNEDAVHLGAMYFDYHKLREKALDSTVGWLSWDSTYLHDHSPQDSSLYEQSCFYGVAGMKKVAEGPWVTFYLDSGLMFTNIGYDTASLEIDYDDGNGWQDLNLNQYVDVNYGVLDTFKQIKVRMKDTLNQWIYAKTPVYVYAVALTTNHDFPVEPDGVIRFGETYTFDSNKPCCAVEMENGRLKDLCRIRRDAPVQIGKDVAMKNGVEIFYWFNDNCETPCHRKPLIIIEGFDPFEKYDYNLLFNEDIVSQIDEGLLNQNYLMDENLSEYINLEDYDLYFINFGFENNTDSIQVNAQWVRQAINEINALKAGCGSVEKNVVIGASMGGLVGRWALSEMEEEGVDHETEQYITFDSPLRGANLPIGFQALIYDLRNTEVFFNKLGDQSESLESAYQAFQRPAAKQMLYYNRFASGEYINTTASTLHQYNASFVNEFEKLNLSIPHLAISNGSILGEKLPFSESQHILEDILPISTMFEFYKSIAGNTSCNPFYEGLNEDQLEYVMGYEALNALAHGVTIYVDVWASPGRTSDNTVMFKRFVDRTFEPFFVFHSEGYYTASNLLPLDNSSGGTSTFNNTEEGGNVGFAFDFAHNNYCFIPTPSSLGIDVPSNLNSNLEDVDVVLNNNNTVVREYRGAIVDNGDNHSSTTNQEHVTLDRNSAVWWRYHTESRGLEDVNGDPILDLTQTFNFGEGPIRAPDILDPNNFIPRQMSNYIDHSFSVNGDGDLWVCKGVNIGFVPDTDMPDNEAETFELNIISGFCGGTQTIIDFNDGTSMALGTTIGGDKSGHVNIEDDSQLHFHDNTYLEMIAESEMVITPTSLLHLYNGATADLNYGSKIIIEENGNLQIDAGATVILDNNSQIIIKEGAVLTISTAAVIELKGSDIGPGGHPISSRILIEPGGTLVLDTLPLIHLDGESSIEIRGSFITEGDVVIDAPNGFLDFYKPSISFLTARDIDGNFRMNGTVRDNLLIRFHDDYSGGLNVNTHNLELYNGKVLLSAVANNIWTNGIGSNGEYIMHNIHFLGQGDIAGGGNPYYDYEPTNKALNLNDIQKLDVKDCIFENVTTGIYLENSDNTNYKVVHTSFKDVFTGIEALKTDRLNLERCKFINPHVELEQATAGISLVDVGYIDINETSIYNFRCGIRSAPHPHPPYNIYSNPFISLRSCTEIVNCYIGVYGESSLVKMYRSGLYYNDFGVAGTDIELDIASTGLLDDYNVYVICKPTGLAAQSNQASIVGPDPDDDQPEVVDPPYSPEGDVCGWIFSIDNSPNVPGGTIAAENNYWSPDPLDWGTHYIIIHDNSTNPSNAQYVDELPRYNLPEDPVPGNCGSPGGGGEEQLLSTSPVIQTSQISIYPNPIEHQLHLTMPQKMDVMVYSTDGQAVFEKLMSDGETINTVQWQPGLYIVRVGTEYFKVIKH